MPPVTMAPIFIFSAILWVSFHLSIAEPKNLQTYIIHVSLPATEANINRESYYRSFLPEVVLDSEEPSRIIHSYHHVACGFAARLSPDEVTEMVKKEGFVSAMPQKMLALQTTHTPDFLGLHQNTGVWEESNYGRGMIIGVIDSGITPGHPSFHEDNMPPPPAKWKGKCEFAGYITCNKKLIGARSFVSGSTDPLDEDGHGTHTSSTAAGNFVDDASVLGNANGTAAGVAPLAHIAMYKVCTKLGCANDAILAAIDAAIDDGVDILSLSLGFPPMKFYDDSIAIGSFAAMRKSITVITSAGNRGPGSATLFNEAPWTLTVGASTHDRKTVATAVLGNGEAYDGVSLFQPKDFPPTLFPVVYPIMYNQETALCEPKSLEVTGVKGKIVVCDNDRKSTADQGQAVKDAGGVAMIFVNTKVFGNTIFEVAHVLPATSLGYAEGQQIKAYINSSSEARAGLHFKGTTIGFKDTPSVAQFSSRGPNFASPGILKPDIIGPGVNILAAWPFSSENMNWTFNIVSGTSVSCPHLSGIAALLKTAHPHWSPAAIKSAIMTTADQSNRNGQPILDERKLPADVFAIGAGHVNPAKASNPGLIYDIQPINYTQYLCGLGYTKEEIGLIVHQNVNCSLISSISEAELNYPSFSIILGPETQNCTRTVTNVGNARSTYAVNITQIQGVDVVVEPATLVFTQVNQQAKYMISFTRKGEISGHFVEGSISWISKKHIVRSPISVKLLFSNTENNNLPTRSSLWLCTFLTHYLIYFIVF
ncbi:subtilisin-like protease [Lycium ferocissimum]|uniref:subtilisin-like protease n=1 Tax=Lycium ferocissimum TaxID=112874 RepID=UPI0028160EC0|nr:subtilisin-like protease [Lycium ferocissimum]